MNILKLVWQTIFGKPPRTEYKLYLDGEMQKIDDDESTPSEQKYLKKLEFLLTEVQKKEAELINDSNPET